MIEKGINDNEIEVFKNNIEKLLMLEDQRLIVLGESHDMPVNLAVMFTSLKEIIEISKKRKVIFVLEGLPWKEGPYTLPELLRRYWLGGHSESGYEFSIAYGLFFEKLIENGIEIHGAEREDCVPNFELEFFQRRLRKQIFTSDYLSEDQVIQKENYIKDTHEKHLEDVYLFLHRDERTINYDNAVIDKVKKLSSIHPDALFLVPFGSDHLPGVLKELEKSGKSNGIYLLHENKDKKDLYRNENVDQIIIKDKDAYLREFWEQQKKGEEPYIELLQSQIAEIHLLNYIDAQRSIASPQTEFISIPFSLIFAKVETGPNQDLVVAEKALSYLKGQKVFFNSGDKEVMKHNPRLNKIINKIPELRNLILEPEVIEKQSCQIL